MWFPPHLPASLGQVSGLSPGTPALSTPAPLAFMASNAIHTLPLPILAPDAVSDCRLGISIRLSTQLLSLHRSATKRLSRTHFLRLSLLPSYRHSGLLKVAHAQTTESPTTPSFSHTPHPICAHILLAFLETRPESNYLLATFTSTTLGRAGLHLGYPAAPNWFPCSHDWPLRGPSQHGPRREAVQP